jgi:hypothetical protein
MSKLLDRLPVVGPAEHGADHQQYDFRERIQLVALNTGVLKRGKVLDKVGRHDELLSQFPAGLPQLYVRDAVYTRSPCANKASSSNDASH